MPVARQVYFYEARNSSQAGTFFLWSQNGIRTIPSEVSAAFKTIKSHLRFFLFLVFRLVYKGNIKKNPNNPPPPKKKKKKKKKNSKNSKTLKAKMGPRMHQIVQFFSKHFRGSMPPPPSMASRLLSSNENTLCFKYCAPNMESWSAPEVLSLQCQTFGIQIRLDVLFSMIWVQLLFCRLHPRYHTEFLAAYILRLVFSRRALI